MEARLTDIEALHRSLERFPGAGLTRSPTPLEPLTRLSAYLGGPTIWVKRDDYTGLGLGGNKLRKLDLVLKDALTQGADTLVSAGVVQSNSQRLVAAAAAKLGLSCHLAVYHGRVEPPTPEYAYSGNAYLNRLFGATLHDVPWSGDRNGAIDRLVQNLAAEGKRPYAVPYGVSNALGAVGYATAAVEIAEQALELGFRPSSLVHSSGSGGTQAGLIAGAAVCLPATEVVGIDIDAEPARVHRDVLRLSEEAASLLGTRLKTGAVDVVAGHAGPAYGVAHPATLEAIALAGRLEALVLDPVYTGKAFAGMISMIQAGRWTRSQNVIFIHTGGTPAVFAYGGFPGET